MTLNFRELEVVWSVLRCGTIKKAAALLNVSQPAVSMMLKNAEDRFGVQLYHRSSGRLHPTAEALALLPSINNIFLGLENFERHLARVRDQQAGLLRIAANQTIAMGFVYNVLSTFYHRRPQTNVVVRSFFDAETIRFVEQREVDLGLAYMPASSSGLEAEELFTTRLVCALHRDHPLAKKELITAEDLATAKVISYRADTLLGKEISHACRAIGVDLVVTVQSTTLAAAHLADQGFGVALIDPVILGIGHFSNIVVRSFEPAVDVHIYLLTRSNEMLSKLAQEFQLHLRKTVPTGLGAELIQSVPA